MKLAFVSTLDIVAWGGSEVLWSETAKLALAQGHEVFTSTCLWEQVPHFIKDLNRQGAHTHFKQGYNPAITVRLYNRVRNMILSDSPQVKELNKFGPDRILINQAGSYDILYNPALVTYLLSTAKPYFIICHNYNEGVVLAGEKRETMLRLFSKAESVFMICRQQSDTIMKQLAFKLPNVRLIENPVNLKEVKCMDLPASDTIQLASVASLHIDRKGQDIALEVLSSEKWKGRCWHFNIYGTGPHKNYLEQLVDYFGLKDKVTFKGHVQDINRLWMENHLLFLSSRIETGPMVLMEAMLCGRPVVATNVGKVPELIQDGFNGYMAAAATVPLFDDALERAWHNKAQWGVIGEAAHHTALAVADLNAPETFLNLLVDIN